MALIEVPISVNTNKGPKTLNPEPKASGAHRPDRPLAMGGGIATIGA